MVQLVRKLIFESHSQLAKYCCFGAVGDPTFYPKVFWFKEFTFVYQNLLAKDINPLFQTHNWMLKGRQ